ncbi:hypothetical protein NQO50_003401 [Vibrio vulnificus]|uniref:hypothetical protein n=1 Tax=Vibrio vulnificus TaxID=672 RepID=UPI003D9CA49C|nr:hypothetical protein [Vibrio vulnificus]
MSYSFDSSELTKEKSLWDVYKECKKLPTNNWHTAILLVVALLLFANAFALEANHSVILRNVRDWAALGFNFSITTLGFLIAGFTIFATLSKPKMMLAMMEHTNPESGLKTLKYNFFAFMKVFIAYIGAAMLFVFVVIFGQSGGLASNIVEYLPNANCVKLVAIKTMYVYLGTTFVYLLLLLATFVYNIYAIVMNFLRWEFYQS